MEVSKAVVDNGKVAQPVTGKSGKKICCSCPDTRKDRDECVVKNGEEHCLKYIDAHKVCLRAEGFTVV